MKTLEAAKAAEASSPFSTGAEARGFDTAMSSYGDAVTATGTPQLPSLDAALEAQSPVVRDAIIESKPTLQALQQGREIAQGITPQAKPTFASRLGDAKDAVVSGLKDRYSGLGSFDRGALMNLGKDVLVADLGASAVEMENAQQQALEDQQLADAGFSVSYPSGFGTQRVIRDSSGVVVNATAQDILARALGGGRWNISSKSHRICSR